jgi:hypothetical protein
MGSPSRSSQRCPLRKKTQPSISLCFHRSRRGKVYPDGARQSEHVPSAGSDRMAGEKEEEEKEKPVVRVQMLAPTQILTQILILLQILIPFLIQILSHRVRSTERIGWGSLSTGWSTCRESTKPPTSWVWISTGS